MDMKDIIENLPVNENFTKQQFGSKVRETNADYSERAVSRLLSELKRSGSLPVLGGV